jgi:hypothetical protein
MCTVQVARDGPRWLVEHDHEPWGLHKSRNITYKAGVPAGPSTEQNASCARAPFTGCVQQIPASFCDCAASRTGRCIILVTAVIHCPAR